MLSKNKIKFIQSLSRKKIREENGLFIAEGEKLIGELINAGFKFHTLISTSEVAYLYSNLNCEIIEVEYSEIKKISQQTTPQYVFAICYQSNQNNEIDFSNNLTIALDGIQDPGNMGTIIRLASWFGIQNIICSIETVDCYNPKVVQATMGAIAHVNITYSNLATTLTEAKLNGVEVFGTFLEGDNIYQTELSKNGIIILGNEGNGISNEIEKLVDRKLLIPSHSMHAVESLNVSMATAIVCSEFRRRIS